MSYAGDALTGGKVPLLIVARPVNAFGWTFQEVHQETTQQLLIYLAQLRHKLEPDLARSRHFVIEPWMGHRFEP